MACTLEAVGVLVLLWLGWKLLDYLLRLPRIGRYNERYILVTGCDSGFGYATAKRLDGMGCNVFAGCLTEKGETDLKSSSSNRLKTIRLEVTDPSSVRKAYEFVKKNLPNGKGLWGILNNAGIGGQLGPIDWLTIDDYKSCMEVNVYGLVDVTITFLPLLKKAKGRVVNTASIMGRFSQHGTAAYNVSKYGVEAFSDSLRRDMHDFGVSVHIIEPGYFKTQMNAADVWQAKMTSTWNRAPSYIREEYGEKFFETTFRKGAENLDKAVYTDISPVINAYIDALTTVYPRARYVVGNDAKYIFLGIQALPEWLGDYVYRLLRRGMPKPAACSRKP